jgi:hypothetical protein
MRDYAESELEAIQPAAEARARPCAGSCALTYGLLNPRGTRSISDLHTSFHHGYA